MEKNDLIHRIINEVSDPVAIFTQDGIIIHPNGAFEKLYKSLHDSMKENLRQNLQSLNLKLKQSGKEFIQKRLGTSSLGFDAFVYFLDALLPGGDLYLVLLKSRGYKEKLPFSKPSRLITPHIIEAKSLPEKLSIEFRELKGEDCNFNLALLAAQKAAGTDLPVLITGESGTGKEILARTIHRASRRSKKPFVDINCAAIPDNLIESELFGYENGAFTGARTGGRSGLFEEAHEGSIFMDEIGDASMQIQSKILRILEDGRFRKIGGNRSIKVDVRLISATNRDLTKLIQKEIFREDLFYRLNTITVNLPPLRERRRDIRLLVDHFLKDHIMQGNELIKFLPETLEILESYGWPGNVRELKGVVDYAATMATNSLVTPDDLPVFLLPTEERGCHNSNNTLPQFKTNEMIGPLSEVIQNVEKNLIKRVLEKSKNRSQAIKTLGISRRTFYIKLKQYNLN